MDPIVTQSDLLSRLHDSYARFHHALGRLTDAHMLIPCMIRSWSVKDLLAHLIAHEQRAILELRLALRGERLAIDHATNDAFNDGAVMASRPLPLEAIRHAWERSFAEVIALIASLPQDAFTPAHPLTVVLDDTIDGALANNTYAHYDEHLPDVELAIQHIHRGDADAGTHAAGA